MRRVAIYSPNGESPGRRNVVEKSSGGVGFWGLLALLFIGLKLGGVIDWSWWWVTAPLWGPLALTLVIVAVFVVAAFIVATFEAVFGLRGR
jgi:hypothetical protein